VRIATAVERRDLLIAAAFVASVEIEVWREDLTPTWLAAIAFGVMGTSLAWWRAAPVPTLVVGLSAQLVAAAGGVTMQSAVTPLLFFVLTFYSVGLREARGRAIAGLVAGMTLVAVTLGVAYANDDFVLSDIPFVLLVVSTPWFVGVAIRGRVRRSEELEARTEQLERERLTAVAEERSRIARELHDVIAHSVSVMVVQAAAAEAVLERDPQVAAASLRAVQETGRQSLVEMSRLVGLLRDDSDELGLAPQPRLDELRELAAQTRDAGLPVTVHVDGARRPLPLGVELTAYRVVQEALTNALKHAGEARAEVTIRYGTEALDLEIVDDGRGNGTGHVGGHGLAGMRERVSIFGGELDAGPRAGGGFRVHVRLPIEDAEL
jgi:signal transduction histidine kinase